MTIESYLNSLEREYNSHSVYSPSSYNDTSNLTTQGLVGGDYTRLGQAPQVENALDPMTLFHLGSAILAPLIGLGIWRLAREYAKPSSERDERRAKERTLRRLREIKEYDIEVEPPEE